MNFSNSQRQARELTLQILFHGEFAEDQDAKTRIHNFRKSFEAPEDVWMYALTVVQGIEENQQNIDSIIETHANNWKIARMALVDANILRIATCEIHFLHEGTPAKVAVNEAIEISKKYGTTESSQFIAGVLGQIINWKK